MDSNKNNEVKKYPINNKTLFFLNYGSANIVPHNNAVALWLRILGTLLLLLFIHVLANYYASRKGFIFGTLVLIVPIILLRLLSYYLPIPINLRQFELFDPSVYGSSLFLRSLGDLLINSLLFVWMAPQMFLLLAVWMAPKSIKLSAVWMVPTWVSL